LVGLKKKALFNNSSSQLSILPYTWENLSTCAKSTSWEQLQFTLVQVLLTFLPSRAKEEAIIASKKLITTSTTGLFLACPSQT
jgi:hypothetical protein